MLSLTSHVPNARGQTCLFFLEFVPFENWRIGFNSLESIRKYMINIYIDFMTCTLQDHQGY